MVSCNLFFARFTISLHAYCLQNYTCTLMPAFINAQESVPVNAACEAFLVSWTEAFSVHTKRLATCLFFFCLCVWHCHPNTVCPCKSSKNNCWKQGKWHFLINRLTNCTTLEKVSDNASLNIHNVVSRFAHVKCSDCEHWNVIFDYAVVLYTCIAESQFPVNGKCMHRTLINMN